MSSKRFMVLERSEFCDWVFRNKILHLLDSKGKDYGGLVANSNFDKQADDLGLSRFQIWSVYFHKHFSALKSWISCGKVESEHITSRIDDMITYLFILRSMIEEDEASKSKTKEIQ